MKFTVYFINKWVRWVVIIAYINTDNLRSHKTLEVTITFGDVRKFIRIPGK